MNSHNPPDHSTQTPSTTKTVTPLLLLTRPPPLLLDEPQPPRRLPDALLRQQEIRLRHSPTRPLLKVDAPLPKLLEARLYVDLRLGLRRLDTIPRAHDALDLTLQRPMIRAC